MNGTNCGTKALMWCSLLLHHNEMKKRKKHQETETSEKIRSLVKPQRLVFNFISDDLVLISASPFSCIRYWHKLLWDVGFWVTVGCSPTVDIKSTCFHQIFWLLPVTERVTLPCRENSTPWMWPRPSAPLTWTGTSSPHQTGPASFTTSWLVSHNSLQQPLYFFFYGATWHQFACSAALKSSRSPPRSSRGLSRVFLLEQDNRGAAGSAAHQPGPVP